MTKSLVCVGLLMASVCVGIDTASAEGMGFHGVRQNVAGGVSSASGFAVRGAQSAGAGASGVVSDGQGHAAQGSVTAIRGPQGRKGVRGAVNTVSADGTVTHTSGAAVVGTRGWLATGGSASSATGTAVHNTQAQSNGGASYSGSTSGIKGEGYSSVTHTSQCTNAAGVVVACPTW